MSESYKHSELVNILYTYVLSMTPPEFRLLVASDGPQSTLSPQRNSKGFRPDVEYFNEGRYIVGEAKTRSDLYSRHSISQYNSYIYECLPVESSCFILAAPFEVSEDARALVHNIINKANCTINYTIINEAGVYYEYTK